MELHTVWQRIVRLPGVVVAEAWPEAMTRADVWPDPEKPVKRRRRKQRIAEPDPNDYNILDSVAPAETPSGWTAVTSPEGVR